MRITCSTPRIGSNWTCWSIICGSQVSTGLDSSLMKSLNQLGLAGSTLIRTLIKYLIGIAASSSGPSQLAVLLWKTPGGGPSLQYMKLASISKAFQTMQANLGRWTVGL